MQKNNLLAYALTQILLGELTARHHPRWWGRGLLSFPRTLPWSQLFRSPYMAYCCKKVEQWFCDCKKLCSQQP